MFDARLRGWIDPPLNAVGRWLARVHIGADEVTLTGFVCGMMGAVAIVFNQMWVALAGYLAIAGGLCTVLTALGINPVWIALVLGAGHIWLGFEAAELHRASLASAGWSDAGSISGRDQQDCERRFFDSWLAGQPTMARHGTDDMTNGGTSIPAPEDRGSPTTPGMIGRLIAASPLGRWLAAKA